MFHFLKTLFFLTIFVAYCIIWFLLEFCGFIQWFADTIVQPHINPERDAYVMIHIILFIILPLLSPLSPSAKK
jgi:hypothetical protein